jgi:NADH dehydrogenase FAD-containing subunit
MSQPKQVVLVVGASYGGLSIAHHLLKHGLSTLPNYQVVLVGASDQVMCRPACPRAMISDDYFDQNKLFVDISKQLAQYPKEKCAFIHGTAQHIDHEQRKAVIKRSDGSEETVEFYALVVATGATTSSPLLSNGADRKEAWNALRAALPSAKSIVIGGGGPTGVELAGELGEHLNGKSGGKPKVSITLVTSGERILPILRSSLATTAEGYLSKLGATVIKGTKVVSVEPHNAGTTTSSIASPTTVSLSNGKTLSADIYIPATGTTPNTNFLSTALLGPDGRITTNPSTLRVDAAGPRIYAIGDCSSAFRPAVHNIIAAVPVLAANIAKDLGAGKGEDKVFKEDTRETQMVPIGKSKGVGAAMGWKLPSTMVWLIKGRDYWVWTTGKLWSGAQW